MKNIKPFIATAALFTACISPHLLAAELVVAVDKITELQGSLYVSLYNNDASFQTNENAVKRQKVRVDKTTMSINFGDLPAGDYAVKAYQDVNNSGAMDFNGPMPAEPFGSSSKSTALAPPSYTDAKFTLDKNQKIEVHLLK